jgi:hypothetical protein
VSALCPCALPSMYISHMAAALQKALACCGWSGCSVITGFLQQPTSSGNQGDIAAGCPGTGSTWHKSCLTLHTCLLHSLLLQAFLAVAWVQGSRSSTAAHTVWTILIQQYQGVQAHCACSMWVQGHAVLPRKATASAAASLCSLVCDCYRV